MNPAGRSCIVTGGGRGIGQAIAQRLCAGGASVVVAARTARELEATVQLCAEEGGLCVPCVTDVSRPREVQALVERAQDEFGRLDALINNAGVAPLSSIEQMTDAAFEQLIQVNVSGVFYACRAAWPALKATRGTIVNISSIAADDPFPGFAAYGGTKAFVNVFTRALAAEGRAHGVRVFAVAPGATETRMLRSHFPGFPAEQTLDPDHVASVVELLLDDRATYATGEIIRVKK